MKLIHRIESYADSASAVHSFLFVVIRGVGQIMFQKSILTGLFFLAGIFVGSVVMGIGTLIATMVGTLTAILLRYDETQIRQGLYGFSAALVGAGLTLFYEPTVWTWIFVVIGSALAAMMQHFFIRRSIAVFTLPFVLATWCIMILFSYSHLSESVVFSRVEVLPNFLLGVLFNGYGQVIFQGAVLSGVLFFVGVLIHSPFMAFMGLAGGAVSGFSAFFLGASHEAVTMGLFGYNAVLCAIAFGGVRKYEYVWPLVAVLASLGISFGMAHYGLTQLTFPFVAATMLTMWVRGIVCKPVV